jgi:hypothetical protein
MGISLGSSKALVAHEPLDAIRIDLCTGKSGSIGMPQIMPSEGFDLSPPQSVFKGRSQYIDVNRS